MKASSDKIIIANIILIAVVTIAFDFIAYNEKEAKGIGFLYFGFIALIIILGLLFLLGIGSFLVSKNALGKTLLLSVLYTILTYAGVQLIFFFIT